MTRRRTEPTRDTDLHQPLHRAMRRDADGRAHGGENGDDQSFYGVWRSKQLGRVQPNLGASGRGASRECAQRGSV